MRLFAKLHVIALIIYLSACRTALYTVGGYSKQEEELTFYLDPENAPNVLIFDHQSASGYTIGYFITRDSIQVFRVCDFIPCTKERVIYKQHIDETAGKAFREFLQSIQVDTLRDHYFKPGSCGLERSVFIQMSPEEHKSIELVRYSHPIVNALVSQVISLITNERIKNL